MKDVHTLSSQQGAVHSLIAGLTGHVAGAETAAELYLSEFVEAMGFEYFSYATMPSWSGGSEGLVITNYPPSWQRLYRQESYHHIDPVMTQGSRAVLPFRWGSREYLNGLSGNERRLFIEARDHRIGEGFTIPVHGPQGEFGLFSVANRESLPELADPSSSIYQGLMTVAPFVHAYSLTFGREDTPPDVLLTEHERVCLKWTSLGKTAWEIAQIIGRSKPTVEYHLQKAMRKMAAANKAHAAALAMKRGLI
ncbi:LuxR family transcriptional regulator [Phyllobacterium sp. 21LDTY02-6]|uniref:helix-turn-helix transcriptional regulator n=1 Tax=Phyllobacterium sp. 21LDTY02-6 TaxID=2944903 RepID=UPI002020AAE7|nr:LuxR family transcriptional regulator [Phyllobacterium sp. 21LDTY02-6]